MTSQPRSKKSQADVSQALVPASSPHDFDSPAVLNPLPHAVALTPALLVQQRSVQQTGGSNIDKKEKKNGSMPPRSLPPPYRSRSQATPPPRQPGNYMTIIRESGPINQSFLVDPALSVPSGLLPPLTPHETEDCRNNLNIEAKYGEIDADIEVMKSDWLARFRVDIRSYGDIVIRLRLPGIVSPDDPTRPGPLCVMNVYTSSGNIYLLIPRKRLEGPLNVTTRRNVSFSPALSKDLNIFSEKEKRRVCFIGNFSAWSEDLGDVINLEAKSGKISVQYNDEPFVKPETEGCIIA
ncbi:hypothetical protein EV421DRAFT_1768726 [Armillaria borealis]|uniref:DUF7330 domain-containing protein n=1 Tax=Armillaria borealis TaxID=47425 RepID=A0AA39MZ96_9AGAR|nr:hypothetical protein EV421DRAFT_1768726 [Armillaria borealis]